MAAPADTELTIQTSEHRAVQIKIRANGSIQLRSGEDATEIAADTTIPVLLENGNQVSVPALVAVRCVMFLNLICDCGTELEPVGPVLVELPEIQFITEYYTGHARVPEWCGQDVARCYRLILAADYLKALDLFDVVMDYTAALFRGKNKQQICEMHGALEGISDEELLAVIKENPWLAPLPGCELFSPAVGAAA